MNHPPVPIEDLLSRADWLSRLSRSLVRGCDAEDAVQETWAAAMRSPPQHAETADAWLAQVLRNFVRGRFRAEAVRRAHAAGVHEEDVSPPSPEDLLERARLQRQLAQIIEDLPETLRTVVQLRFYEGQSSADIARTLGVPAGTVRWRLSEALERLRDALDETQSTRKKPWRAVLLPLSAPRPRIGTLLRQGTRAKVLAGAVLLVALLAIGIGAWRGDSGRGADIGPLGAGERKRNAVAVVGEEAHAVGGAVIEGSVVSADGTPVGGPVVALTRASEAMFAPARPERTTTTDAVGRFVFEGLAAGDCLITATADGMAAAASAPLTLSESQRLSIVLRAATSGFAVSGRVLDVGGGGLVGVWSASRRVKPSRRQAARSAST